MVEKKTVRVEDNSVRAVFCFLEKKVKMMPEQSVRRRDEDDPDQQGCDVKQPSGGDKHENDRHNCSGGL